MQNSPTFANVQKTYIPILLGGLHKQCGNLAPILVKNKKEWINKERERWAEIFQIPIRGAPPPGFPISTVHAQRALTALSGEEGVDAAVLERAIGVFWAALWCPDAEILKDAKGRGEDGEFDVKRLETLQGLLAGVEGVGEELAGKIVKMAGEKDVKDKLMGNTTRAFESGAFGMPWFECTNGEGRTEGFWGFDHIGQVVRFLGLDEGGDRKRSGQMVKAML